MSNAALLFKRQLTDTFRNKTVLIQFLLFPILTLIMQKMVRPEGLPENFFVTLFGTMYVGMAPMTAAAAIIAEEKEKNTLRVLLLAGVRPREYLIGSGGAVFLPCLIGGAGSVRRGSIPRRSGCSFWLCWRPEPSFRSCWAGRSGWPAAARCRRPR